MKKFYVWQLLVMLLLLAANPYSGVGQTGGNECNRCLAVDPDPCNGCTDWYTPVGCDVRLRVRILVANLNQGEDIVKDSTYQLPTGYPLLYLEHTIEGNTGVSLANAFKFSHYAQTSGGAVPMFEQIIDIFFNIEDQCDETPGGFVPETTLRLITYDQFNNVILYPMYLYSAEDDIFSCLVFVETCNYCDNPLEVCPPGPTSPIYEVDEFVPCTSCNGEIREDNDEDQGQEQLNNLFKASPNPFTDQIEIKYQFAERTTAQIELLDLNGRVIHRQVVKPSEQSGYVQIDASNLANGIYYCRMTSAHNQQVIRLLKMD